MIGKVCPRGSDVRRLLGYLLRDGRAGEHGLASEHTDAHLIAGWDDPARLEPVRLADGRPDLRHLAGLLNAPLAVAGAPERPVYHLAIAAAKDPRTGGLRDPLLSDEQWADIAATYLHHLGLAPRDDPGAVRWVAVRHAGDHIHVVATLARQDGARVQLFRDYAKSRAASHAVEAQYGLTPTGNIDGTSQPATTHAEHRHARQRAQQDARAGQGSRSGQDRQGREQAGGQDPCGDLRGGGQGRGQESTARVRLDRDVLRHQVAVAAATSNGLPDFLDRLTAADVLVRLRHSTQHPGQVTGYAVALPPAEPPGEAGLVWFGGGKLAPDLTLPRLRQRWDPAADAGRIGSAAGSQAWNQVTVAAAAGRRRLEQAANSRDPSTWAEADGLAHASADLLLAAASRLEGQPGGPVTDAAQHYLRAARPRPGIVRHSPLSRHLRAAARALPMLGPPTRGERAALVALLTQLDALTRAVHRLRAAQDRQAQAAAAATAAALLGYATDLQPQPSLSRAPPVRAASFTPPPPHRARLQ